MKLDSTASGVFVIAATPFTEAGALDFASIDTMVDYYLRSGASHNFSHIFWVELYFLRIF